MRLNGMLRRIDSVRLHILSSLPVILFSSHAGVSSMLCVGCGQAAENTLIPISSEPSVLNAALLAASVYNRFDFGITTPQEG